MDQFIKPIPQQSPGELLLPRKTFSMVLLIALKSIWETLTRNRKVTIGVVIILLFIIIGLIGPSLSPYPPDKLYVGPKKSPPTLEHPLGTTDLGADIFSQLMTGTRSSIFWSLATSVIVTIVSIAVGLVSGYFGGIVDDGLSLITNVFLVLPSLPLAIVMAAYFPRGAISVASVVLITNWAWGARVLRAQTMSMRNREFITSARSSGEHLWRILFIEILPNEMGLVAANFVSTAVWVVLTWASLDFLGLGDPNSISWGSMLYQAEQTSALIIGMWWWFIPPGLCIAFLGTALTLINFGIDEIADPRLRIERIPKFLKKKVIA